MLELEERFKQSGGEWREFRLDELFKSYNGDFDIQEIHLNNKGHFVISSGEQNCGVIGKTDIKARAFPKNTITCDMFGNVFYRNFDYKMVTHARVFCLEFIAGRFNDKIALFICATIKFLRLKFQYSNMASWKKIHKSTIQLPVYSNNQIAFDYMEAFIKELEAYLLVTGLSNTRLSQKEKEALQVFAKLRDSENGGGVCARFRVA